MPINLAVSLKMFFLFCWNYVFGSHKHTKRDFSHNKNFLKNNHTYKLLMGKKLSPFLYTCLQNVWQAITTVKTKINKSPNRKKAQWRDLKKIWSQLNCSSVAITLLRYYLNLTTFDDKKSRELQVYRKDEILMITLISCKQLGGYKIMRNTV